MPQTAKKRGLARYAFPYALVSPTIVLLTGFLIFPVLALFYYGFHETAIDGGIEFVGFKSFVDLFSESRFRLDILNTVIYLCGNLAISIPLGYITAILVSSGFRLAGLMRTTFIIPWVMAPVVSALLVRTLLNPTDGPIIALFTWIYGEPVYPTLTAGGSMAVIVLHSAWRSFPLIMLLLAASMTSISREVYEAARLDGAGRWQQFWYITLPLTKAALFSSMLAISVFTIHDAEGVFAVTRGGPGNATETVAVRLFKEAFVSFNIGQAATLGVVLVVLSILIIAIQVLVFGRRGQGE